jgi:hypothetical protein
MKLISGVESQRQFRASLQQMEVVSTAEVGSFDSPIRNLTRSLINLDRWKHIKRATDI